jgi:hypothetical protein
VFTASTCVDAQRVPESYSTDRPEVLFCFIFQKVEAVRSRALFCGANPIVIGVAARSAAGLAGLRVIAALSEGLNLGGTMATPAKRKRKRRELSHSSPRHRRDALMFLRGRGDKGACAIDIINAGIVLTSNMALDVLQELKKAKLVEELPARDEEERKFSGYRRWRAVDQLTKSKRKIARVPLKA